MPNNPPPDTSDSVSVTIEGELDVEFAWAGRRDKSVTRVLLCVNGEQIDVTGSPIVGRPGLNIEDLTVVETALDQASTLEEQDAARPADQMRDSDAA